MQKGRPPQLTLFPSDPALAASMPVEQQLMDEDRGVLSDVSYSSAVCASQC
jgi:hypothetical protein